MKFPITRETLQEFTLDQEYKERKEEHLQSQVAEMLRQICSEFKHTMLLNMGAKRFIWRGLKTVRTKEKPEREEMCAVLMSKLRETFIDCDITVDALKTYIIIDWS